MATATSPREAARLRYGTLARSVVVTAAGIAPALIVGSR
jgi:hypothetical protein